MGSAHAFPAVAATVIAASLFLAPVSGAEAAPESSRSPEPPGSSVSCMVTDPRITEASGMADTADRLFLVNDGGDDLSVFELDRTCRTLEVRSDPTDPFDVEDLARTPDGMLWFADIGDNRENRRTVALETLSPSGTVSLYRLRYPDGAHDAEALLVGRSDRPYLVTKNPLGVSGVYTPARPPSTGADTPLRKVTTLRFLPTGTPGGPVGAISQLLVTGGAVSPDGTRVALRTYTDLYLWTVRGGDIGSALRSGRPTRLALPEERQGESVAFSPDGRSVLTTSEGTPAPVHLVPLPPPGPTPSGPAGPSARPSGPVPSTAAGADKPAPRNGSRSVLVNLVLAALIATVIVFGLGRIRRK